MFKKLLILLMFLSTFVGYSQMCNTTPTNMGALTLTTAWQNAAANSGAKRYWTFNATAGCTYDFSSCNSVNTNDTYLRLYLGTVPTTAVLQTSNDDNGPWCTGTKASISWVCPTTGVYSILLTNYSCANISSNSILSYRQTCSPPYNPCTTIPTITCGSVNNITIASGTGIYNPPSTTCGFSTPGKEYIFSFTPTVTGNYSISQPTSFGYIDWFYKVASGGCTGTGWTCIDDISNANLGNGNVNIPLTAGTTYYIMADPESTTGGSVSWSLNCAVAPPSNDNCSNAINIPSFPYTSPITANNASSDDVPTSISNCGSQGSNIWYRLTGDGNQLTVSTCNVSTNFDTEIRIYTGSCASLNTMVEVICNDDDANCASNGVNSTVTWCSEAGVVYYVSVGYFISGTGYGNFVLSATSNFPCTILPIELIEFKGVNKGNFNELHWVSATELNNHYYTLERSSDGFYWDEITRINGAGTVSTPSFYSYDDYFFIKNKINYYRLKQTDFDGQHNYFNIVYIDNSKNNEPKLIKTVNYLGQEVNPNEGGLLIQMYDDGSIKRIFNR